MTNSTCKRHHFKGSSTCRNCGVVNSQLQSKKLRPSGKGQGLRLHSVEVVRLISKRKRKGLV